jgi:O-acetylserine/cysteine efflux transporter
MTNRLSETHKAAPTQHAGLPLTHILLALAVVAVWGTNFVVIKVALAEMPPLLFATLRFTFVLLPVVLFVPRPRIAWSALAAYGLLIGFGQFALLFIAMDGLISPGLASLVVQSQVFFTIGLSMWSHGERIRGYQVVALLLATVGIGIILFHGDRSATPVGLILTLLAAASWAGGNHVSKRSGVTDMFGFVIWSSLFSVPPLLATALLLEGPVKIGHALIHAGPWAWAAIVWQSVGNTMFGYVAWGWLLNRHPAATITPMAMLIPCFGMGASALLLGEGLPSWKIFAALLVMSGLAINILMPMAARLPGFPWRRGAN